MARIYLYKTRIFTIFRDFFTSKARKPNRPQSGHINTSFVRGEFLFVSFQDLRSSESTGKLTVHRSCRGNIAFSDAAPDGSQVGIENNTSGVKGKVTPVDIHVDSSN